MIGSRPHLIAPSQTAFFTLHLHSSLSLCMSASRWSLPVFLLVISHWYYFCLLGLATYAPKLAGIVSTNRMLPHLSVGVPVFTLCVRERENERGTKMEEEVWR